MHVLFSAFETKIAVHPAKNIKGNRDVQYLLQIKCIFETSNAFFSFAFKAFKNDSYSGYIIWLDAKFFLSIKHLYEPDLLLI